MTANPILRFVARLPEYAVGVLVLTLTVFINVEVALRYFLNLPLGEVEELGRVLFLWLSFLGAAVGVGKGAHMSIDFLHGRVSPRTYYVVGVLATVLVMVFGAYVTWDGVRLARQSFLEALVVTRWPVGLQFSAVPVSGALVFIYALRNLLDQVGIWPREQPAERGHA